jgi:hypothetical protein
LLFHRGGYFCLVCLAVKPAAAFYLNFSHTACCPANQNPDQCQPAGFTDLLIIKQLALRLVVEQRIRNFIY